MKKEKEKDKENEKEKPVTTPTSRAPTIRFPLGVQAIVRVALASSWSQILAEKRGGKRIKSVGSLLIPEPSSMKVICVTPRLQWYPNTSLQPYAQTLWKPKRNKQEKMNEK